MQNTTDAFTSQQTLAYMQGRKACNIGRSAESNPYVGGSLKSAAWMNGFLDSEQSAITGRACTIRR